MANRFEENTWSEEQKELDARILAAFGSLEGQCGQVQSAGIALDAFAASNKSTADAALADIAALEHKGRQQHWLSEFARLGFTLKLPTKKATPAPDLTPPAPDAGGDGKK